MTLAARPQNKMSAEKTNLARNLARDGHDHVQIASLLDENEDAILQALAALRTRNPRASRKSLNVNIPTWEFVKNEGRPGVPVWDTTADLMNELIMARSELLWRRALKPPQR